MTRRAAALADLTDDVTDLVHGRTERSPLTPTARRVHGKTAHTVHVPSLLDQLRDALAPAADPDAALTRGYASRPTLRTDALDTLTRIETRTARWLRHGFGLEPRRAPEDNLRALARAAASATDDTLTTLARDVHAWATAARTVTGWDSPPWRPYATCPACDSLGGLRVRLATRSALCADCGATWDSDHIGVLADHVRRTAEPPRPPRPP